MAKKKKKTHASGKLTVFILHNLLVSNRITKKKKKNQFKRTKCL